MLNVWLQVWIVTAGFVFFLGGSVIGGLYLFEKPRKWSGVFFGVAFAIFGIACIRFQTSIANFLHSDWLRLQDRVVGIGIGLLFISLIFFVACFRWPRLSKTHALGSILVSIVIIMMAILLGAAVQYT
jgi:hypothetical protein